MICTRLLIYCQTTALFTDRANASEDLHAFAKLNEGRLYKLLKTSMDTQTDLKALVKNTVRFSRLCLNVPSCHAQNEFLRRVEQSSSTILETMSVIHRKASLWIINTSSIPSLVKRIQRAPTEDSDDPGPSDAERLARVAKVALTYISKHCPAIYKPHVGEFAKALADEKNARLGEVGLQALAALRWEASDKYDNLC